jgi:hypothetical protein
LGRFNLLQRVANPPGQRNGWEILLDLRWYPATLLLYGGGIAAVAGEHYGLLLGLLTKPKLVNELRGREEPPLRVLVPNHLVAKDVALEVFKKNWKFPMSEHLFQHLRESFRALLPVDREYQLHFDRFEYLTALVQADVTDATRTFGCYIYRSHHSDEVTQRVAEEGASVQWPLYKAGWFGGDRSRFLKAKEKVDAVIARLGWD